MKRRDFLPSLGLIIAAGPAAGVPAAMAAKRTPGEPEMKIIRIEGDPSMGPNRAPDGFPDRYALPGMDPPVRPLTSVSAAMEQLLRARRYEFTEAVLDLMQGSALRLRDFRCTLSMQDPLRHRFTPGACGTGRCRWQHGLERTQHFSDATVTLDSGYTTREWTITTFVCVSMEENGSIYATVCDKDTRREGYQGWETADWKTVLGGALPEGWEEDNTQPRSRPGHHPRINRIRHTLK